MNRRLGRGLRVGHGSLATIRHWRSRSSGRLDNRRRTDGRRADWSATAFQGDLFALALDILDKKRLFYDQET